MPLTNQADNLFYGEIYVGGQKVSVIFDSLQGVSWVYDAERDWTMSPENCGEIDCLKMKPTYKYSKSKTKHRVQNILKAMLSSHYYVEGSVEQDNISFDNQKNNFEIAFINVGGLDLNLGKFE